MTLARPCVAPALLALACTLPAAETVTLTNGQAPVVNSPNVNSLKAGDAGLAPLGEVGPGRSALGASRQVVVQGLFDLDALQRNNLTDGNNDASDHRSFGILRAELGLKVKMDERASAVIGFGYRAELGDYGPSNTSPAPEPGPGESPSKSDDSQLVLKDAYVTLGEFLGYEEFGLSAGRMPVAWTLRADRGAFLYDSRADDADVGSWDGARASYSGFEEWTLSPWVFRLPDASSIWGITADWKPTTTSGRDKLLVTFNYSEARNVVLDSTGSVQGDRLRTFGGGLDWQIGELGLWAEGASQRGTAADGASFRGWGANAGLDWQFASYGKAKLTVIGDWLSGDDNPADDQHRAFVNTWESTSDTLLVEHEKYGELSRLMDGNLRDLKVRIGSGFDERDKFRFELTAAHYELSEPLTQDGSTAFGNEVDLRLRWQYTYHAQLGFFAGMFKPGDGFRDAAQAQLDTDAAAQTPPATAPSADTDAIWIFGANLNVAF